MPRFYCNQPLEIGLRIALPEAVAHHVQVLRLREGEIINLFNGLGGEYNAVLTAVERRRAEVELKTFSPREAEPGHAIALAQALPEGAKMDWIVEKAVELARQPYNRWSRSVRWCASMPNAPRKRPRTGKA